MAVAGGPSVPGPTDVAPGSHLHTTMQITYLKLNVWLQELKLDDFYDMGLLTKEEIEVLER